MGEVVIGQVDVLGGGHDGGGIRGVPLGFAFEGWDVNDLTV